MKKKFNKEVMEDGVQAFSEGLRKNRDLYPRHKECPECFFNLLRYKMRMGLSSSVFIDRCPECKTELVGW